METQRILVVDDSISIVNSLSKILEISGFIVDPAYNGSDALRKLSATNYDLVICDIEMPGITGLDFLERVRKNYGNKIDVILMTGFLDQDYFIRAIRLGASDFVRKPINAQLIIRSIKTILDRKREQNDFTDFYRHLDMTSLNFVIDPKNFSKFSISKVFNVFLVSNFNFCQNTLNELLICIDEMIYNAYIHGTLKLNIDERFIDRESFGKLIGERLRDPEIAARRIRFSISIDQVKNAISLEVEDDGEGFDHEAWVKRVQQDQSLNIDEHGRGISLLYHLSDELTFEDGGRRIRVTKNLNDGLFKPLTD